jgi:hypothetical protein
MFSGRTPNLHPNSDGNTDRDPLMGKRRSSGHPSGAPGSSVARSATGSPTAERIALLRWVAGVGAVTAEALSVHLDVSVASARARLRAAGSAGFVQRSRPLAEQPALHTLTAAGVMAAGAYHLDPCRVSPANALHLIECARAAAALERCYPDHVVQGERELRGEERRADRVLASAELDAGDRGPARSRHRPDLVLWPASPPGGLPVAVEVELTVKAPARLAAICRAWARARCVAGVLYLAPPLVERALLRAIARASAAERVVVVPLEALRVPYVSRVDGAAESRESGGLA